MLRRWALPLLALLIVACAQTPDAPPSPGGGGEQHAGLQDTSAAGAKYTLLHAWAPW